MIYSYPEVSGSCVGPWNNETEVSSYYGKPVIAFDMFVSRPAARHCQISCAESKWRYYRLPHYDDFDTSGGTNWFSSSEQGNFVVSPRARESCMGRSDGYQRDGFCIASLSYLSRRIIAHAANTNFESVTSSDGRFELSLQRKWSPVIRQKHSE